MKACLSRRPRSSEEAASTPLPIQILSVADLPTRSGDFRVVAFTPDEHGDDHVAIVRGMVRGRSDVPMRIHSECLTGDVIGSLRCDCRDQLQSSLDQLGAQPYGALLYLRQEGRGIGLGNKIRAYALQDSGHDTVDANHMLGFGDDERDYRVAVEMVRALGIESVQLMTNNPRKLEGLRQHGIPISGRLPLIMPPNRHNASYLLTKQQRSGHLLEMSESKPHAAGGRLVTELRPAAGE